MSEAATATREIVVEETFPHRPETIWQALTTGDLIGRWFMAPTGFAPVPGTRFTFQTKAGGAWDGVIHCEVLEAVPHERLVYSWRGGHPDNTGYGAPLDTTVSWTLTPTAEGTRIRLVHAGFVVPRNQSALETMGNGWKKVVPALGNAVAGQD
jgi:uncharacterized protein YndB with AHSA1/START domain